MIILGIDIGKNGGIALNKNGDISGYPFCFTSFMETYNHLELLFKNNAIDGVITGKPNRIYNIIMRHAPYIGIIGLLCEEYDIPLVIESDCTIRACVLGKGNGRRKDLVHEKYKGITPDVSDAMMFAEYLYLKQA